MWTQTPYNMTTFINGNLEAKIFMEQPEGIVQKRREHLVSKLKKLPHKLKESSRAHPNGSKVTYEP